MSFYQPNPTQLLSLYDGSTVTTITPIVTWITPILHQHHTLPQVWLFSSKVRCGFPWKGLGLKLLCGSRLKDNPQVLQIWR